LQVIINTYCSSLELKGNGIGLSLCKQVMMLHRGQITVQSIEKEGSVFTLIFDMI
jgi:signal transduction histidine kinase